MTKRYGTTIKKMRSGAARAALLVMVAVFASTSLFAADALVGAAYPGGGSSPIAKAADAPTLASDIKITPSPSSLTVTWTKGSATKIYSIKVKESSGSGTSRIANYKESKGTGIVSGLSDNTSYTVTITPIQSGVRGEAKEFRTKTKAKHSALPNSSVKGSNLNSITINIGSYSNSSDTRAPEKCVLIYSKNKNMSGARTVLVAPRNSNYTLRGLTSETQYFFEFGSYYTSNGSKVFSELTKKYSGKTKVSRLTKNGANAKHLLAALKTTKVKAGTTINVMLPFVITGSQKESRQQRRDRILQQCRYSRLQEDEDICDGIRQGQAGRPEDQRHRKEGEKIQVQEKAGRLCQQPASQGLQLRLHIQQR